MCIVMLQIRIFLQMILILQNLQFLNTVVKNNNLRQFNLLNVKPCTEAPSNIQHAKVKSRVYFRAKTQRGKAFK